MRFWDTSAIVPLVLKQGKSEEMVALAASDDAIAVWWGTRVEVHSAVSRLSRLGELDETEAAEALRELTGLLGFAHELEPSEAIRSVACRIAQVYALSAADALQLAAALAWVERDPSNRHFVCLDRGLCEAARREGFDVFPQGTPRAGR
jgi:predicted nucleic acid-binding protein